jgi:acetyl esterase/lipase
MRIIQNAAPFPNVSLTAYLHDEPTEWSTTAKWPAMLVLPGGGYTILASHEGEPIATRYYAEGFNAFVLRYTVYDPDGSQEPLGLVPLRDASWAIQTIRENASSWRVDVNRVTALGFSAGGHLAGSLAVLCNHPKLEEIWDTKNGLNRPDSVVLCYPVITAGKFSHKGSIFMLVGDGDPELFSLEMHVSKNTPPVFLWHTVDDAAVSVENSLLLLTALKKHGVPFESHLFATGEHGIGLANGYSGRRQDHIAQWFDLSVQWLKSF